MKKLPLMLSTLVFALSGCGGSGGGGGTSADPGLAFDAISPDIAVQGHELDLYVRVMPTTAEEVGRSTTVTVSATSGVTLDETSFNVLVPAQRTFVGHVVHLKAPTGAPVGSQYTITVRRTVATDASSTPSARKTITITDHDAEATVTPNFVNAPAGSSATATIGLLPVGNASGTVLFNSNSVYTVTPSSITLTAGQTTPTTATVTFTVPTTPGSQIVPISWSFAGHSKFVPFPLTVTQ